MQEQTNNFTSPSLQIIPQNEAIHHAHSFADPDGRVFLWADQLYRGIFPSTAAFYKRLSENGIISNLVEKGLLVDTELTDFSLDGYSLIFRHRLIPFASYPQEWCLLMFKDAALAIVDLAIELAHCNLLLKDAHPWNLLFDACKPVYVDLGSIAPLDSSFIWPAYPEFCCYCLYPLILMSQGHDLIGRLLMCEERGVRENELFRLAPHLALTAYTRWPISLIHSYAEQYLDSAINRLVPTTSASRKQDRSQKTLLRFLKQLRQFVENIPLASFDFQKGKREGHLDPVQEHQNAWTLKSEVINQLLTQLHPVSVLDVNSGNGLLAKQAVQLGSRVVCFETNHRSVSLLYREAKTKGLSILPLVMDFTKPTPARGLGNHWAIAATERFQCDLVLALDLMNQQMPQRLGFEQIINGLSQFSKRWLVFEFPAETDNDRIHIQDDYSKGLSFESCVQLLERQFRTVTKVEHPIKGSTLLVCEK